MANMSFLASLPYWYTSCLLNCYLASRFWSSSSFDSSESPNDTNHKTLDGRWSFPVGSVFELAVLLLRGEFCIKGWWYLTAGQPSASCAQWVWESCMQYTALHILNKVLTWVQPSGPRLLLSPHGWQSCGSLSGTGSGTVQLICMQMGTKCRVLIAAVWIKEQSLKISHLSAVSLTCRHRWWKFQGESHQNQFSSRESRMHKSWWR